MRHRLPHRYGRRENPTVESVFLRLFTTCGDSPATWHNRMYGEGSDYRRVAQMNTVLRELGLPNKAAELMQPVYASMEAAPRMEGNTELIAAKADCSEDDAEAEFRAHRCEQTARVLLRKRAIERQTSLDNDRDIAAEFGIAL